MYIVNLSLRRNFSTDASIDILHSTYNLSFVLWKTDFSDVYFRVCFFWVWGDLSRIVALTFQKWNTPTNGRALSELFQVAFHDWILPPVEPAKARCEGVSLFTCRQGFFCC